MRCSFGWSLHSRPTPRISSFILAIGYEYIRWNFTHTIDKRGAQVQSVIVHTIVPHVFATVRVKCHTHANNLVCDYVYCFLGRILAAMRRLEADLQRSPLEDRRNTRARSLPSKGPNYPHRERKREQHEKGGDTVPTAKGPSLASPSPVYHSAPPPSCPSFSCSWPSASRPPWPAPAPPCSCPRLRRVSP